MGWRGQDNRERDERASYFAETTWWERAADRARTALTIAVPIIILAAVYWIARGR